LRLIEDSFTIEGAAMAAAVAAAGITSGVNSGVADKV
jgi:hypothetical protein